MPDRRTFLQTASAALLPLHTPHFMASQDLLPPPTSIPVETLPQHFDVDRTITNFDNGYWGVMPRLTTDAYLRNIAYVNRFNSVFARNAMPNHPLFAELQSARDSVAGLLRVQPEEIAFTRSGSEGLQSLLLNYRHLKPGDAVIFCDLDYDNTIAALNYLRDHRGIQLARFTMPEPASTANILAAYDTVLKQTPNARLLLLTHVSHRTGLIPPVREIIGMARARGVDTILDSAHAIGCLDTTPDSTGADFIGWSMHKWLAAPLGLGAVYIRKSRIPDIDLSVDNPDYAPTDIRARIPVGTTNFAAELTVPAAVAFHRAIGPAQKEAHLRALRNSWVDRARTLPGLDITVPADPALSCAITSFRIRNMRTEADAKRVADRLLTQHRILTVVRTGIAAGPALRITPGLYTTPADIDALVTALEAEHTMLT